MIIAVYVLRIVVDPRRHGGCAFSMWRMMCDAAAARCVTRSQRLTLDTGQPRCFIQGDELNTNKPTKHGID